MNGTKLIVIKDHAEQAKKKKFSAAVVLRHCSYDSANACDTHVANTYVRHHAKKI
jgi:hypothetical protein